MEDTDTSSPPKVSGSSASSPLVLILLAVASCTSIAALVVGAMALSEVRSLPAPPTTGLSTLSAFEGFWELQLFRNEYGTEYNTSGPLLLYPRQTSTNSFFVDSVDTDGRFNATRCVSGTNPGLATNALIFGVISPRFETATSQIYFNNGFNFPGGIEAYNGSRTPSFRWGTWRYTFHSDTEATVCLENTLFVSDSPVTSSFVACGTARKNPNQSRC